ncbi:cell differentiation protein rcd1-like [Bidens hawaiensis]|uniref:cell differentiation protein rcd1-like n=1 Tax=Bidens hawaiensis TaxID=980011 RepID=UPI00404A2E69
MENLPETIDVDPSDGSSSGSTRAESVERARIEHCINLLHLPSQTEEALVLLNKERRCEDMPLMLWNAKNVSFILLQSMASHPDTKMKIVKAKLPVYVYPFMNTTEKGIKQFDYLRLTSLGVIGALVKVEDNNTPEIIHFLLETEVLPLCLRCIDVGSELAKTVAAFLVSKILLYEEGQRYCSTFPERFFAIAQVLANTVDRFLGKPPPQLLKHILKCFMRLTEVSRLVG